MDSISLHVHKVSLHDLSSIQDRGGANSGQVHHVMSLALDRRPIGDRHFLRAEVPVWVDLVTWRTREA